MPKYILIIILGVGMIVWSCDQKVKMVLPLVGLYGGQILGCDFEQILLPGKVKQDSSTTMDSSVISVPTPFIRRMAIAYVSDFVNENEEFVNNLGVKPNKEFLVIQTNWLCVNNYPEAQAPLDTFSVDLLTSTAPVVIQVTKSEKGRTNFKLVGDSQEIMDLGNNSTLHIAGLTGFYYNASLQVEYQVLKNGRGAPILSNTMVGLKN